MAKALTELKLLACQRNDQTWSAVPGEEVIPGDEAGAFEQGALVMVNLNNNRQIQGTPESAGAQVVRDLQRFSRLQEKLKAQEEEIEGWKQSLTLQAQELNKREMELEAELAQMEQLLEQQGGGGAGGGASNEELQRLKEEQERLKEEFQRKTADLEQAWEHLRGEQRRFEEQKSESPFAEATQVAPAGLSPEQVNRLQELVNYLETTIAPTEELRHQLNSALEFLEHQQETVEGYSRQWEEQQTQLQEQQSQVEKESQELDRREQQYQASAVAVEQAQQELDHCQAQITFKQNLIETIAEQIQSQNQLRQILSGLPTGKEGAVGALEKMPLEELQTIVENLQKELEKLERFVAEQEEELRFQQEAVEELEEKLRTASVYDASSIEQELADEQESKKMLDETLVGQRRTLAEKQTVLRQHLSVLQRRQGISPANEGGQVDLAPAIATIEAEQQNLALKQQKLESELANLQETLQTVQANLQAQMNQREARQQAVKEQENKLQESQSQVSHLLGKVALYEALLKPWQEELNNLRQPLEAISENLNQVQQTGDYQQEAIGNLKQAVSDLS